MRHAQKGVALVMVLLALALATTLAAGMLTRQSLQIQKSAQYLNQRQGQSLALGAESFARQILFRDWEEDKKDQSFVDDPSELWNRYSAAFPVEYGSIELQIDETQGRYNLNDLVKADGKVDPVLRKRLERLLQILEIQSLQLDRLVDWMDGDEETSGAYGAEDGTYLSRTPPFRVANRPMGSLSELRLIEGVEEEDILKLQPHVVVLPVRGAGLNINMASAEILRSFDERITSANAESILADRENAPFKTVQDFIARPEFAGLGIKAGGLTVQSVFFEVRSQVNFDGQFYRLLSVIYRNDQGEFSTVSRDESRTLLITKERVTAPP